MQTATHVTTQAVVAHYLRHQRAPLTCVVNVGIHDETLVDAEPYSLFVRHFMALLAKPCAKVVWLTTSAANSTENFQKNEHIAHRNARVTAEMQAFVDIIDVFNASLSGAFNHADNVHMDAAYYATLARILHP